MYRIIVAAAGLALLTGAASAETIERTVKANTISALGGFLGYEVNTCYPSVIPDVKVRQAPANGTIQIRPYEQALGKDSTARARRSAVSPSSMRRTRVSRGDEVVLDIPWSSNDLGLPNLMTKTYRIRVE
ncbi:hypothetical protein [Microvirga tunisiensis]|uniref:Uncharacterized protein n=1 Tax=Microvirga tunisiensis TaxID=2108360 RepID=A0A5N7MHT2_9HYPH|nr:hypothetical protein [Microvirga tunisiensis]MPR08219.1 hypothetical protein [Microvirga tunisiensis]MPR26453.1 hypothetical protein [Microvirga tunisiensis]